MLLAVIGSVLRVWHIGEAHLWYDEIGSLWMAQAPFWNMVAATAGDVHPPGYLALLWVWVRLVGDSAAMVRALSALLSLAGFIPLAALADELGLRPGAQIMAGLLYAISPWQIAYAQEARMYALLQLLVLTGAWAAVSRRRVALALILSAMLWTHNYGVIYCAVLGALAMVVEFRQRQPQWPALAVSGLAGLAGYAPWGLALAQQIGAQQGSWWQQPVSPGMVADTLHAFLFAGTLSSGLSTVDQVLVGAVVAFVVWQVGRAWSFRADLSVNGTLSRAGLTLAWLTVSPGLLAIMLEMFYRPIWLDRALIGASPMLYLLLAWALFQVQSKWRWMMVGALLPMVVISLLAYYPWKLQTKGFSWPAADIIRAEFRPGDVIYHVNAGTLMQFHLDWPGAPRQYVAPVWPDDQGALSAQTLTALGADQRWLKDVYWVRAWVLWSASPTVSASQDAYVRDILSHYPNRQVMQLNVPWMPDGLTDGGLWLVTH